MRDPRLLPPPPPPQEIATSRELEWRAEQSGRASLGTLTFQGKARARVVLPRSRSHHPGYRAGKGRHSRARRGRIQSRQKSPPVRSLSPGCDLSSLLLLLLPFFFFLTSSSSLHALPTPPPHPGCSRTRPEAGEGGEVGAEVGAGKVATRKFKQTNTPTPSPPPPAGLGHKLCARMRRAELGHQARRRRGQDAAGSRAPASDCRATRSRARGQSS